ncbi:MAG: hypothetical protein AAGH83_04140 [Pseudomonadota bacterium]
MRSLRHALLVSLTLALGLPQVVQAGTIVAPVQIQNEPSGNLAGFPVVNLINQDGLLAPYSPGVTDFDAFTAAVWHKDPSFAGNGGFASPSNFVTTYDFLMDFGAVTRLSRLALWNDTSTQGVGHLTVFASNADYSVRLSLGRFEAFNFLPGFVAAQVFDFVDASSQYFVVRATAQDRAQNSLNFGEFAFEETLAPIPVPAAFLLLGTALAALGMCRAARKGSWGLLAA